MTLGIEPSYRQFVPVLRGHAEVVGRGAERGVVLLRLHLDVQRRRADAKRVSGLDPVGDLGVARRCVEINQ